MKKVLILLLNMLLILPVIAQSTEPNTSGNDSSATVVNSSNTNSFQKPFIKKQFTNDNMHFSFQTGASAMSFGNSSVFTTFVAPQLSFSLSPKLNITVGTIALNSNFNNMMYYNYNEGTTTAAPNASQMFLYLKGEYQVNERLRLRGSTFREVSNSANPANNPFSFNQVGVDFKINDNMSISADIIQSKGQYPMGLYGVNNPAFRSNYPIGGGYNTFGW